MIHLIVFLMLASQPALADTDISLDDFQRGSVNENLSIKQAEAAKNAAQEGAAGIALPPPMAGITQMQDSSGTGTGFEISQSIPFPSKITADRTARKNEANAKSAMKDVKIKEISAEAKLLYFRLFKAQEKITLLQEKKEALAQHLKLASATARSDGFAKIHLIKTENDIDVLETEIMQARQDFRERQIQAAEFMNRDPKTFRPVAKDFPMSDLPKSEALQSPPQLESKKLELESLKARESEAKSSWYPDFNVRYRENAGTTMTPKSTEIMVGASLPFLFFWEPRATSGKVSAERLQGEYSLAQESRQIEARKETLLSRAETLKLQLQQIKGKIIPRAEKRIRFVHNVAQRDMETLQDHKETVEAVPDLKMKALELREQYEESVSELEKYISGEKK